jgi:hypothetical protein
LISKKNAKNWAKTRAPLWLGILIFIVLALQPSVPAGRQNPEAESFRLTTANKEGLAEALRLKAEIGDEVWPGLSSVDIPIVLYNESSEFLVGNVNPASPWRVVPGDDFKGRPYFRRTAEKPQAFAVAVGGRWAGSIGTFEYMKLGRDFHVVAILHEVFHVFQAIRALDRFRGALAVYQWESRYPFKNAEFSAAWNSEGETLAGALKADEPNMVLDLGQKFLDIRDARRQRAALPPELVSFERELEWLEGLAKYAEVRFCELAAARTFDPASTKYRTVLPYVQWDLTRLRTSLGQQKGDLRFYLSGMAEAKLLDRLSPGWKAGALEEKAYLEDALRAALARSPSR